ncbi:hypothetical protein TVAG_269950 [Trichomonas vaginalis G3]|uniref:Uncharacterized protein n=1 Tax=Trichomonas vaginalis (strain ATCC PRA-98 / G3) TaxID=412133 RepID=A2F987_TRIV3|nr:hypothetical protein TVAGG3_0321710 [Trichomonas vaginalis G3]EAX98510.1 hypothetical protein TVAG_269950 [Trichomonas vaginalis G3]KAI5529343.1 hypothetical protein TVAGG3_0321710 [Trichomonas vaginalis G3]|eukprot:XP_001311440.1 hypothetical protein [Trichomonas vaginalis G3]
MEDFNRLRQVVPAIPELLLDACTKASISTRDKIISDSRAAIIIHRMKKVIQLNDLIPIAEDSPENVQPQQIQFISVLIDFLHSSPQILISCLKEKYHNGDKTDFKVLCWSAIPSIYGFYSTLEHISNAFPFYCMLITKMNQNVAIEAILPFYISACTFKFIESVYQGFAIKFCNDVRINGKKLPTKIIDEYIPQIIDSIIKALPLLPQQHVFLIKFMLAQGWNSNDVLDFFIHRFVMHQLIRYLNSTPFKHHYDHFCSVAKSINIHNPIVQDLIKFFETNSIFEVPPAFTVFDIPFTLILISRNDVDVIIRSLMAINELPKTMVPFLKYNYFQTITNRPFWMRIYSRKPKPIDTSYNWRSVVFDDIKVDDIPKDINFTRVWNKINSDCSDMGVHPLVFLTNPPSDPDQLAKYNMFQTMLGKDKENFIDLATRKSLKILKSHAESFENYLVHNLALQSLTKWLSVVEDCLRMFVIPFAEDAINNELKEVSPKSLIRNPRYIDLLLERAASKVDLSITRRLQYLFVIQYMMTTLIGPQTNEMMKKIDLKWLSLLNELRPTMPLPECFSNKKKNKEIALLLNGKLWRIISLLNSMQTVKFGSTYFIFMKVIKQLEELEVAANSEDTVTQYALVLSNCPILLSRFILNNAFFVKHERFRMMSDTDYHLVRWCRLETAILKIVSQDMNFMNEVLNFQEMLISAKLL